MMITCVGPDGLHHVYDELTTDELTTLPLSQMNLCFNLLQILEPAAEMIAQVKHLIDTCPLQGLDDGNAC